jgi:alpha-galactosidase
MATRSTRTPRRTLRRADLLSLARALGTVSVAGGMGGAAACTPGRFDGLREGGAASRGNVAAAATTVAQPLDRPAEIALQDAFVRYDPSETAWTIGNARFEERLELRPAPQGGYSLQRRSLAARARDIGLDIAASEAGDAAANAVQDVIGVALEGPPLQLTPLDHRLEQLAGGALHAALRFLDATRGAEVTHEVRLRPGHAVVEHRSTVHYPREKRIRLTRLDSADFVVRSGNGARWRAASLDTQGNVSFVRLGPDGMLATETPAQSAARAPVVPLLLLHDATNDEGLFLALRWSANYRIAVHAIGDRRVAVEAGVRMTSDPALDALTAIDRDAGFYLQPGQTISSPWLILGIYEGGMEDGTNSLKSYVTADRPREPAWAAEVMPVAWNSWFAYGTGVDASTMQAEARAARTVGAEVFYVDYGWSRALGDWTPHPQRFPGRTLRQLSDQVHAARMRFGLWVAFGVADEDSDLLRAHPEFRARQPTPARTGIDGSLPLCLMRAQPYLRAELARIVREYRLDWLKFDQPMVAACLDVTHGHDSSVRGSLHANNQAFYDLLSSLRAEFPELFVESTFDGAGYLDYGVFSRSHGAWLDDAAGDPSVPMQTVQQSAYGATLAFPPRFLTLWLGRGQQPDSQAGRSLSPRDLAYQGYSTMGGAWGLSLRLEDLDQAQRAILADLIADYRALRTFLPGAHVYHLAPSLALPGPTALGVVTAGPTVADWYAMQFWQPEQDRGAILVVHNQDGSDRRLLRLRGLQPEEVYRVEWTDGRHVTTDTGEALLRQDLVVELPPLSGGVMTVRGI